MMAILINIVLVVENVLDNVEFFADNIDTPRKGIEQYKKETF